MHLKLGAIAALLAGLALAVYVILQIGIAPLMGAIATAGWGGFTLVVLFGLVVIVFLGIAWQVLSTDNPRWIVFFAARQLRDSASELLPFTQVGGIVAGARATILG